MWSPNSGYESRGISGCGGKGGGESGCDFEVLKVDAKVEIHCISSLESRAEVKAEVEEES